MSIFSKGRGDVIDDFNNYKRTSAVDIAIKDLEVDESYQRNIYPTHVNYIRRNFDHDLFGTIIVSQRDGHYWVVDGRQRLAAVDGMWKTVPCTLWKGLTYKQECEKFRKLNAHRKPVNACVIFHGKVCEGDETANAVASIMREYGFGYNRFNFSPRDNVIGSPAKMLEIYQTDGEKILRRILHINREAWHGIKSGLSAMMLVGLRTFLVDCPSVRDDYLIRALSTVEPMIIKKRAELHSTADAVGMASRGGHSSQMHIANAIKEIYNNKLPGRVKAQYMLK